MDSERSVVYDDRIGTLEALDLSRQGVKLLCPRCKSVLIVVASAEDAKKTHMHPGIYYPVSQSHVVVLLSLRSVKDSVKEHL